MNSKRLTMTGTWGLPRLAVALLFLLTAVPGVARAAELTVCPTGPPDCQYTSIQEAVDAAGTGDVIKVATGTYTGVSNHGGLAQVVYIDKTVTIRGGYTAPAFSEPPDPEANATTLDAGGQGRVIYITKNIEPTVEGLHIIGGDAAGLGGWGVMDGGGGVFVHKARPTFSNNWIIDNAAGGGGGLLLDRGEATLSGNTVISNTAETGGGLLLAQSTATLSGNTVTDNTAAGRGGGLRLERGHATLSSNTISENTSGEGGGLALPPKQRRTPQQHRHQQLRRERRWAAPGLQRRHSQRQHHR